jgi:hypothetical protein
VTSKKAPDYPGEDVPVLDLWELFVSGRGARLMLGVSTPADAERLLGAATDAQEDDGLLVQRFDDVMLVYDGHHKLWSVRTDTLRRQFLAQDPPNNPVLHDLHANDGALRFNGECITNFATLPRLIERLPVETTPRYSAQSWDQAILIEMIGDTCTLNFVYRLQVFESDDRGRFAADYFLDHCRLTITAMPFRGACKTA